MTDQEIEEMASRWVHDQEFVKPGRIIVLSFYDAILTFKAGYKKAIEKKAKTVRRSKLWHRDGQIIIQQAPDEIMIRHDWKPLSRADFEELLGE